MRRKRSSDEDVPLLTDVVEVGGAPDIPAETAEALAREIERRVLDGLGDALDRMIEQRLARWLGEFLDATRADVSESVRKLVRETVTAALAESLPARGSPRSGER